jgi:hypothetical protein
VKARVLDWRDYAVRVRSARTNPRIVKVPCDYCMGERIISIGNLPPVACAYCAGTGYVCIEAQGGNRE